MCDQAVDTSTIQGRFVVQIMSAVAELERSLISERTRSALASKRKRGGECGGFANVSRPLAQRIVAARDDGVSFAEIARSFTAEGIPTATGGAEWNPSTVRTVYKRYTRDIDLGIVEEVVAKGATFP